MLIKQSWSSSEKRKCENEIFSRNSCKCVKGASEFTILCLLLALLYCIRPNRYESCLLNLSVPSHMWQTLNTLKAFQSLSSTDSGLASSWLLKEEDKRMWSTNNALKMSQISFIQCLRRSFLVPYHCPVKHPLWSQVKEGSVTQVTHQTRECTSLLTSI
jgi:hypothetical protein